MVMLNEVNHNKEREFKYHLFDMIMHLDWYFKDKIGNETKTERRKSIKDNIISIIDDDLDCLYS